MKKRNIFLVLLFSIITFGIYILFWLSSIRKDVIKQTGNQKLIPPVWLLLSPLLFIVLLIFLAILAPSVPGTNDPVVNVTVALGALGSIIALFVVSFWWFYKFFQGIHVLIQTTDPVMLYVLFITLTLLGLGPFWVLIVQNDVNKYLEVLSSGPPPAAPVQPVANQDQAAPTDTPPENHQLQ